VSYVKAGGNCIACPSLIFSFSGSGPPPYVFSFSTNFDAQGGNGLLNLVMYG